MCTPRIYSEIAHLTLSRAKSDRNLNPTTIPFFNTIIHLENILSKVENQMLAFNSCMFLIIQTHTEATMSSSSSGIFISLEQHRYLHTYTSEWEYGGSDEDGNSPVYAGQSTRVIPSTKGPFHQGRILNLPISASPPWWLFMYPMWSFAKCHLCGYSFTGKPLFSSNNNLFL